MISLYPMIIVNTYQFYELFGWFSWIFYVKKLLFCMNFTQLIFGPFHNEKLFPYFCISVIFPKAINWKYSINLVSTQYKLSENLNKYLIHLINVCNWTVHNSFPKYTYKTPIYYMNDRFNFVLHFTVWSIKNEKKKNRRKHHASYITLNI